jgi:hypothetical protein
VQPPWRRRNSSCEASWLLDDEQNVQQPRAVEPGPKLKSLLECLLILIVRGVFDGDGVVTVTDFASFLHLAFPLCWYIFRLWGRRRIGDELHDVILQYIIHVITTTLGKSVLGGFGHD